MDWRRREGSVDTDGKMVFAWPFCISKLAVT